jgi:hypothetical protein
VTQTPQPGAKPVPRPEPLAWLIEHKERWPKEAILREPMEFPAVSGAKVVGSLTVPAGVAIKVQDITKQEVAADFMAELAVSRFLRPIFQPGPPRNWPKQKRNQNGLTSEPP